MPKSQKCHKYILCVIDEVTNFLIMVPIFQARSEEVGEALLEHVITKHCIPNYIIMDQDSAFMPSLMTYLFQRLNIKIKTIASYNCDTHEIQGKSREFHWFELYRSFLPTYYLLQVTTCMVYPWEAVGV